MREDSVYRAGSERAGPTAMAQPPVCVAVVRWVIEGSALLVGLRRSEAHALNRTGALASSYQDRGESTAAGIASRCN